MQVLGSTPQLNIQGPTQGNETDLLVTHDRIVPPLIWTDAVRCGTMQAFLPQLGTDMS